MEEVIDKIDTDLQKIWSKAYNFKDIATLDQVFEMYDELIDYWYSMFGDASFCYEGYRMICEGLGDAYFMFDTDGPEQNDLTDRLVELVEQHKEDSKVKEIWTKIQMEKIEQDFN